MIWTKYTIKTTTKDADMVSAILMDYGINDVQIENNVQLTDEELNQMYADFVKELPPDDGSCSLSFYMEFEDNADRSETDRMIDELDKGLEEAVSLFGIDPVELVCEDLNSADWENNWKEFFKPFSVDRILIAPTWEELPENPEEILSVDEIANFVHTEEEQCGESAKDDSGNLSANTEKTTGPEIKNGRMIPDIIIRIDPGMAFGTGTHETTRLCLRALQDCLKQGDSVLDLGCGSGILGIASVKLGASCVVSVDIDEQAVAVAKENFELNEVSEKVCRFFVGNAAQNENLQEEILHVGEALAGTKGFDVVVVNILADVIAVMMPSLDKYLKEGGVLITSGILKEKEEMIRKAVDDNPNLELLSVKQDGDWVSVTAKCSRAGCPA